MNNLKKAQNEVKELQTLHALADGVVGAFSLDDDNIFIDAWLDTTAAIWKQLKSAEAKLIQIAYAALKASGLMSKADAELVNVALTAKNYKVYNKVVSLCLKYDDSL